MVGFGRKLVKIHSDCRPRSDSQRSLPGGHEYPWSVPTPSNGADSGIPGAAYSEGGSLFALGLINAGCGSGRQVENYLRDALKTAQGEVVQHGAALGLGVAGMGGKNGEAYDDLKQTLFNDSAIASEAAGYAMGLIMLGTGDENCADEMLTYARETHHEKIIRGLAIGIAFIYYGRQEQADTIVKQLLGEKVTQIVIIRVLVI